MKRLWNSESAVMVSEGFCPAGHGKLTVRELSDFGAEPTPQGGKQAGACEECARVSGDLVVLHAAGMP